MEPASSSTAAGIAGWKLIGGLAGLGAVGAALASIVVMCLMTPRSPKEWAVGIISTVVSSIAGGSAVIEHYGLQSWAHSPFGLVAMLGLVFACGLPGWALVRWTFNYINKHQADTITDVAADLRKAGN
jgi:predicted exporter